jgi:hypothetical protein
MPLQELTSFLTLSLLLASLLVLRLLPLFAMLFRLFISLLPLLFRPALPVTLRLSMLGLTRGDSPPVPIIAVFMESLLVKCRGSLLSAVDWLFKPLLRRRLVLQRGRRRSDLWFL